MIRLYYRITKTKAQEAQCPPVLFLSLGLTQGKPPLFGCDGTAYCSVLTDRFTLGEVLGKALIIHDRPDDFTTQPSGNAGTKIACGIIRAN